MKKIILVLFLLTFGLIVLTIFSPPPAFSPTLTSVEPSPVLALAQFGNYRYTWVKLDNLANLKLLPNHDAQESSEDLAQTNHCQVLINGNFYDENDQPLGWLVSQGKTISQPLVSNLFNGFFYLLAGRPVISAVYPETKVDLGLQSGPLLILDSKPLLLKINNDQPRRRVIAALNDQNQLIFLILIGSDSIYSGPLLADTPKLVADLGKVIDQNLVAAINLDGGSASAFYTDTVRLNEYSYIGSFFCYN